MRDIWQTTNVDYGAKWGLATNPKKLKSRNDDIDLLDSLILAMLFVK